MDLCLTDITPLQLNWPKLGRAICRALSLDSKATPINVPNTLQIGSWSGLPAGDLSLSHSDHVPQSGFPDWGSKMVAGSGSQWERAGVRGVDAVPVFLTIQTERHHLYYVICDLIIRLRQKIILLTPTNKHFDAKSQELLAAANSSIFALDSILTLNPDGTLTADPTLDFGLWTLDSPSLKFKVRSFKVQQFPSLATL